MSTTALTIAAAERRPRPPGSLLEVGAPDAFVPALRLAEWVRECYLDEDGPFTTPDHEHLRSAQISFLWTNVEHKRHQRRILGQAELAKNIAVRLGAWQRARSDVQMLEWFGDFPDFLITLDAFNAEECPDMNFCALVDHELYHCAQASDRMGEPAFDKNTGLPKYQLRGHDVEEFVGVVRRFGVAAAGDAAVDMVITAAREPEIGSAELAQACGTCVRLAA